MKTGAKICVVLSILFLLTALCFPVVAPLILDSGSAKGVVTPAKQDAPYCLGIYEGKLASFKTGEPLPLEIYDIPLSFFSDYDQMLLQKGIPAKDRDALQILIENYTS